MYCSKVSTSGGEDGFTIAIAILLHWAEGLFPTLLFFQYTTYPYECVILSLRSHFRPPGSAPEGRAAAECKLETYKAAKHRPCSPYERNDGLPRRQTALLPRLSMALTRRSFFLPGANLIHERQQWGL